MRAVVGYESMFGNTRRVAEAVGEGLAGTYEVQVVPVQELDHALTFDVDLLVLGAPTHAWSLSRPSTRKSARQQTEKSNGTLFLEEGADGPGLREWFARAHSVPTTAAAFATRMDASALLTGSAARRIARQLRRQHAVLAVTPESFVVTKQNTLLPGELDHARLWGREVAAAAPRVRARR
jgi:hypothetical protein